MKNRNLLIIVVVIVGLFAIFKMRKKRDKNFVPPPRHQVSASRDADGSAAKQNQGSRGTARGSAEQPLSDNAETAGATTTPKVISREVNFTEIYQADSQKKVEDVLSKSSLKVPLPEDHLFDKIDIDIEDAIAMYGRNAAGNSGLTFIAAKRNPATEEITRYLKQASDNFPNLNGKDVQWGSEIRDVKFSEQSGIQEGKLWKGTDSNGVVYVAVLLRRQDGQGSYLFVKNGPPGMINNNEEYYERFRDGVQALPVGQ